MDATESTELSTEESAAKEKGWNPDGALSAEAWTEKGDKTHAGIKRHRDELKETVEKQGSQIEHLMETNRMAGEAQAKVREQDRLKSEDRIRGLEAQLEAAVTDSDGASYTRLRKEIKDEESNLTSPEPKSNADFDRMAADFQGKNDWYGKDQDKTDLADAIANRLQRQGITGQYYFDEIERGVNKANPSENKARQSSNGVETSSAQESISSDAQTYESLPKDAQDVCDRFVRDGVCKDRKAYLESYYS